MPRQSLTGKRRWQFFIDVGGTFTDVVAVEPCGDVRQLKLLSSGAVRGTVARLLDPRTIVASTQSSAPRDFWKDFTIRLRESEAKVKSFDPDKLTLHLDRNVRGADGNDFSLSSDCPAPVIAIRYLMNLSPRESVGDVDVKLGTTRATNALLERKGARTAFVTTRGFGDILKIGNQDRPRLFDLRIQKRDELATRVIEIDERITASGQAIVAPDPGVVARELEDALNQGVTALAVCLLHSHVNDSHERLIERIARDVGFQQVSVSSEVCRLEGIVARGDTTVADAYLSEAIASYVDALRTLLPDAHLRMMASNGGLVRAEAVHAKDTILSGPAGGVVGTAAVCNAAGDRQVIAFDMGGTSTDVARITTDPIHYEYQTEAVKAGVRLMTPMIAVETVAAGGGSVCGFDGQMLTVGPHSAGAEPGPASYGQCGPLTITDVNVALGRIDPRHFPFQLDREAVNTALNGIAERIREITGKELSIPALARGFLDIAIDHMAAAIRRISVARGFDPRDHVLCCYGGAGGQHACLLADSLRVEKILISQFAGVQSALGIGVADIRRVEQCSVALQLNRESLDMAKLRLQDMCAEITRKLAEDGEEVAAAQEVHTVELCYQGQSTMIPVQLRSLEELTTAFEEAHVRLYGYAHQGRIIEIRRLRAEVGVAGGSIDFAVPKFPDQVPRSTSIDMYVGGEKKRVRVLRRTEIPIGTRLDGPVMIVDSTSTTVVEPDWKAEIDGLGNIVLSRTTSPTAHTAPTAVIDDVESDPIQLEIFNNRFSAIAEEMGAALRRTALSTNVKERLDYSCAVFTAAGELVVNAPHIPVHLGAMSTTVKALLSAGTAIRPGDVFVTNDPARGGSHLNDVTLITPVHAPDCDHIIFFTASRAHHAEIGGKCPGSMPPDSRFLAEEGVLIPMSLWASGGESCESDVRHLLTSGRFPSRMPDENIADLTAQAAANQAGAQRLLGLIESRGLETVLDFMGRIQRAACNKMSAALGEIPDGTYHFEDGMDDGTKIHLTIQIKGEHASLDFTGTDPVHAGNLNANPAIVTSAVLYCLRCLIAEDIPLNSGVLEPVEIILPDCFLCPTFTASPTSSPAVVGGNVETSQRIVDCIFGALGTVAASQGTMNNLLFGDQHFGYYETICGGTGAGPDFQGADAVHSHMTNTRLTDPEVLESRFPLRLIRFEIRRGSGGRGKFRGGDGVIREIQALKPLECSVLSQRRETAPYGLRGGQEGKRGRNTLVRQQSSEPVTLPAIAHLQLDEGDRVRIETPGGGGYGTDSS